MIGFSVCAVNNYSNASPSSENVPDSILLKKYNSLAEDFQGKNPDSTLYFLKKGAAICKKLDTSDKAIKNSPELFYHCAEHKIIYGYYYYISQQYLEALKSFQEAENIFDRLNKPNRKAEALNNCAVILTGIGNNVEALQNYHRALEIYRSTNDTLGCALTLNNLSRIYRDQGNLDQAIKLVKESLEFSTAIEAKEAEALALNSLAGLRKEVGDTVKALAMYEKSLSIRKSLGDKKGMASVLNNIGSLYKHQHRYEEAMRHFEKSQKISEEINYTIGVAHTLYNQGEVLLELSKVSLAEEKGRKALEIGQQLPDVLIIIRASELLMKVYKEKNNWEKAFEMQELNNKMKSKLLNEESQRISQKETVKYEFEKQRAIESKEKEQNEQLAREKERKQGFLYLAITLVALVLILLLFFVIQRLRSAKEQNRLISKQSNERKLLLQEIHHRVKNNFQIVSSLLRLQSYSVENEKLKESFDEAVNRINSMSVVHDIIYRQESFSEIDSKQYLEKLVSTLKKSSGNPDIQIEISTKEYRLNIETLIHLGIALNELIINSFKYAFNESHFRPKIRISLSEEVSGEYLLLYQDNGIGINKEIDKDSFGMELIQTLIEHMEGFVEVASLPEWPTTITIRFKDL
ncbi:MAG: tetratricopeptide repeat protein [Brumimicrobium sp.]|nr:tetratricopeptide repeat protein [Brumimicrobium sp.]